MKEVAVAQIIELLTHAAALYHRLVIVAAPSGCGKTVALQAVAERIEAPIFNVNLEILGADC